MGRALAVEVTGLLKRALGVEEGVGPVSAGAELPEEPDFLEGRLKKTGAA